MEQLIFFILGLIGAICQCIMKFNSLSKDAKVANVNFLFKDYLKNDYLSIVLSILSVIVWLLLFGEAVAKYPALENFARASFFVMGLVGSYLIQKVSSVSKNRIRNIVDEKTNRADNT